MIEMGRGKPTEERTKRGFRIQWTIVAITLGLMTAAGGAGLLASPFFEATAIYKNDWLALALIASGLFTANMARMLQIWAKLEPAISLPPARRSKDQRNLAERGFRELFLYVFSTFVALTTVAFLSAQTSLPFWGTLGINGLGSSKTVGPHVWTLIGVLCVSLIPPLVGFYLQASREQEAFGRQLFRSDAISASSFWMSTVLIVAIIALASWAARVSQNQQEGVAANLAYWITFAVIALFIAFIFLPHVQRYIDHLAERERDPNEAKGNTPLLIGAPAIAVSWADSVLVRLIAPLTGATQQGPLVPHSFVVFSLLPLTALGFVLPEPYGLAPIALGMLMVIALGRRWAWIEEDREIASRLLRTDGKEIQIGFENDLKDEALLGYAFLFILVPLALHQINGIFHAFTGSDGAPITDPFFAWLSFFGGELAKAVPFVDWWEIYSVDIQTPVAGACAGSATDCTLGVVPAAKHLTFIARAMVDLVIMAALFQAIGIWQRSRAQDKLYDAGQLDAFDPFTEERFFRSGMRKRRSAPNSQNAHSESGPQFTPRHTFEERIERHLHERLDRGLPLVPYNERRLGELLQHQDQEVREGAEWMVEHYGLLAGTPLERLKQLSDDWSKAWQVGNRRTPPVRTLDSESQTAWRRSEKLRLEKLLDELLNGNRGATLTKFQQEDISRIVQIILIAGDEPEFQFSRVLMLEILQSVFHPDALWALAFQVCPNKPEFQDWHDHFAGIFGQLVRVGPDTQKTPRFGRQETRVLAYRAIEESALGFEDGDPLLERLLDLLKLIKETPKAETKSIAGPALKRTIDALAKASRKQIVTNTNDDAPPTNQTEEEEEDE